MNFDIEELLHNQDCPNIWHEMLAAGRYSNGKVTVTDAKAQEILARCPKTALRGMGDMVAIMAQPIARAIDKVAGTNLKKCGRCKARQARLNDLMPFGGEKRPL